MILVDSAQRMVCKHTVLFRLQDEWKLRILGLIIIGKIHEWQWQSQYTTVEFTLRFTNEVKGAQQCNWTADAMGLYTTYTGLAPVASLVIPTVSTYCGNNNLFCKDNDLVCVCSSACKYPTCIKLLTLSTWCAEHLLFVPPQWVKT